MVMLLFLAACGQRGPLYLPKPGQEPAKTLETETSETEESKTEDDREKMPWTRMGQKVLYALECLSAEFYFPQITQITQISLWNN